MGFLLTLLYVTLAYLSVADILPALAPYRIMIWVGALAVFGSALAVVRNQFTFRGPQLYLMVGLMGAIVLSRLAIGWFGGALRAFPEFGLTAVVLYFVACNVSSLAKLRTLMTVFVLVSLYLVARGLLAYHFDLGADQFVLLQRVYTDPAASYRDILPRIRGVGFLEDPNDLAQNLLIALAFVGAAWRSARLGRNFLIVILPGLILLYGLYLTRSRGALLGLGVLVAFALKDRFGTVFSAVVSIILVAVMIALNYSAGRGLVVQEGRLNIWSDGLGMFKASPVLGVGFHAFTEYSSQTAHNSFLLCLVELGLLGCFFWLGMIVFSVIELNTLARLPATQQANTDLIRWAKVIRLGFFTFLVTSWFLSRTYVVTLFLLIGLSMALAEIARQRSVPNLPQIGFKWFALTGTIQVFLVFCVYIMVRMRSVLA